MSIEDQLAELYPQLADKFIAMIPTQWSQLYYLGEVEKGKLSWSSVFYFTDANSGKIMRSHEIPASYNVSWRVYRELLSELDDILLTMYDCFAEYEQALWEQISLSLSRAGKLNIDFKYDAMNENAGSQVRREIVWAYETFGYAPEGNDYFMKILDEYIQAKTANQ
ncbi:MAG: antitoxin YezG family protein [Oscillospiraceae bacterium]|jgi:uncharacterized protein (TIGR01741 family)|nr:antitoxin YezG family protein [Oscillospiraceae bacterium]